MAGVPPMKKRLVDAQTQERMHAPENYNVHALRDSKGLLTNLEVPIKIERHGRSLPLWVDSERNFSFVRLALCPLDQKRLGYETLDVCLPRMPWFRELAAYADILQGNVTPTDIGLPPTITRETVCAAVSWLAGFTAFRSILFYNDGYLWHSYQAHCTDTGGRRAFCHCDPFAITGPEGQLPMSHAHRFRSGKPAPPSHYNFYVTVPWTPHIRFQLLLHCRDVLKADTIPIVDRIQLMTAVEIAFRSLLPCPIPNELIPAPVLSILQALDESMDLTDSEASPSLPREFAAADECGHQTMDMTLLFGQWRLSGSITLSQ